MDQNHDNRLYVIIGKYIHVYNITCVIAFPKCTGGAPHGFLALLLGAGDSGGLDNIEESLTCWLKCSVEAFVDTLSDA